MIIVRIVFSGLLSCAGTVFRFHCLFLCFITAESNSERVVGSNYFICLQTNSMWGNCDSANTSRLGSYYLFTDHCNVEKNVLWLCLWAGFPLSVSELMLMWGKPVTKLRLSLHFYYSVDFSAGSLLPIFRPL